MEKVILILVVGTQLSGRGLSTSNYEGRPQSKFPTCPTASKKFIA